MENFKPISKHDVWERLQAGERVYAIVLRSRRWDKGVMEIWHKGYTVENINSLLSDNEKNVVFYEEVNNGQERE